MADSVDYGLLSNTVSTAAILIGATGAITLSWKGRAKWEPIEEDVSRGPQKVAGLTAAVLLALARARLFRTQYADLLGALAVISLSGALLSLLFYGSVVSLWTYEKRLVAGQAKVIGGLWLTASVRAKIGKAGPPTDPNAGPPTVQQAFNDGGFDKDYIWPRPSQMLAKQAFVLGYMGLVVCGSTALALAAMVLDLSRNEPQ